MTTLWSNRVKELDKRWREDGFKNYRKDVRDKIAQLLPKGGNILDVGCGNAMLYEHLPEKLKSRYTGVDFTPEFIELCREKHPEGNWQLEDSLNLSFPDNRFQLVNSTTLLQHIPEWKKAASELVRVSKKYVVSTCRTHLLRTSIVSTEPVLRRRFNPGDIMNFYSQYGEVDWQWADGIVVEKPALGIYVLEKFKDV